MGEHAIKLSYRLRRLTTSKRVGMLRLKRSIYRCACLQALVPAKSVPIKRFEFKQLKPCLSACSFVMHLRRVSEVAGMVDHHVLPVADCRNYDGHLLWVVYWPLQRCSAYRHPSCSFPFSFSHHAFSIHLRVAPLASFASCFPFRHASSLHHLSAFCHPFSFHHASSFHHWSSYHAHLSFHHVLSAFHSHLLLHELLWSKHPPCGHPLSFHHVHSSFHLHLPSQHVLLWAQDASCWRSRLQNLALLSLAFSFPRSLSLSRDLPAEGLVAVGVAAAAAAAKGACNADKEVLLEEDVLDWTCCLRCSSWCWSVVVVVVVVVVWREPDVV